jgi:hypothetical protein
MELSSNREPFEGNVTEREIIVTWKTGEVENWGKMVGLYAKDMVDAWNQVEEQCPNLNLIKSIRLGKKLEDEE